MDTLALKKLLKYNSISRRNFLQGFKTVQKTSSHDDGSIFSSLNTNKEISELYDKFDINDDGIIDEKDSIDENTFSEDEMSQEDLDLLVEEFNQMFQSAEDAALAEAASPSSGGGSVGGGGGGGGSVSSGSGSGDTSTSADSDTSAPKSIENMTEDELKTQKQTASNNVQEKKNELSAYESGEKPGKEDMEKAYQEYTEALGEEKTEKLEQKQNEIKEKHREAKENITNQITTVSAELDTQNNTLTQAQQTYDIASNKITTLENKKSALEGSLSSAEEDKKTAIEKQIEAIETEITTAETEKTEADNLVTQTKTEISELEGKKAALEAQLQAEEQAEQQELIEVENEITGDDTELKAKQEAYDKAKETYETQKAQGIKEAKEALATAQKELSAVEVQLAKVQHENEVNEKYPTGAAGLPGKYNLAGTEYNSILDQNKLDKLAQDAANGGAGNKWGHPDCCLTISYSYGLWLTGDSNRAFNDKGVFNYSDGGSYKEFKNDDKSVLLAKVKEELDSGRPVILHVNGKSDHSRHYVAVVGYKSSAGSTLKEDDLLLWDSYDSTIRACGRNVPKGVKSRHMIDGYATGRTTYGWQIYVRT